MAEHTSSPHKKSSTLAFFLASSVLLLGRASPIRHSDKYVTRSADVAASGVYYKPGELDTCVPLTGRATIWMDGEHLLPTQGCFGDPVDGQTLSIATWGFPCGESVKVVNPKNNKSVVLRVTDRGPDRIRFPGRIADITPMARDIIGLQNSLDGIVSLYPEGPYCSQIEEEKRNIPDNSPVPTPQCDYRVNPGDTLFGIARRSGTSIAALQRLNSIGNPNVITAGACLKVE